MSLAALRANPANALANNLYYFQGPFPLVPGMGMVGQAGGAPANVTRLAYMPAPGGQDVYYPYVHGTPPGCTAAGINDGSVAVTGGMNGCALEVVVKNGQYVFYHDPNGNRMNQVQVAGGIGTTQCRIEAGAYWDAAWAAQLAQALQTPMIQFVCAYSGGFWHVGCFRFSIDNAGTIHGGGPGMGNGYVGYFNDNVRLIRR